jgi:hypothetical protein
MCCVYAFSLCRESPNMILGDKPLILDVVLSQWSPHYWLFYAFICSRSLRRVARKVTTKLQICLLLGSSFYLVREFINNKQVELQGLIKVLPSMKQVWHLVASMCHLQHNLMQVWHRVTSVLTFKVVFTTIFLICILLALITWYMHSFRWCHCLAWWEHQHDHWRWFYSSASWAEPYG